MVIRLNINIFQRDLLYILVRFLIEKWDKVVEDRGVFGALLTDLSKSSMREKLPNMEFFLGPHLPVFRPEETLYLDTFHTVLLTAIRTSLLLPNYTLPKKCLYSEFFWSLFSRIEYEEKRSISPYSVRMWANTDQKNSEYRHFTQ